MSDMNDKMDELKQDLKTKQAQGKAKKEELKGDLKKKGDRLSDQ